MLLIASLQNLKAQGQLTLTADVHDAGCHKVSDGSITLAATGGSPPYQFKTNQTFYSPLSYFSGLVQGTYTVSVKDNAGAIATNTVTVGYDNTICCSGYSYNVNRVFDDPITSSQFAAYLQVYYPNNVSISGRTACIDGIPDYIYINNTLTMDGDFCIKNCPKLFFNKYGKIVNTSLNLLIQSSKLQQCNQLWRGIEAINNDAKVTIRGATPNNQNCYIGNAECGVSLKNGAKCDIQNTNFTLDSTAIAIEGYHTSTSDVVIKNNYIHFNQTGIWIKNNPSESTITIGDFNTSPLVSQYGSSFPPCNVIEANHKYGVQIDSVSNVKILGNMLLDNGTNIAIFASSKILNTYDYNHVEIGDIDSFGRNLIQGSLSVNNYPFGYGILSTGTVHLDILSNYFDQNTNGLYVIKNNQARVNINYNIQPHFSHDKLINLGYSYFDILNVKYNFFRPNQIPLNQITNSTPCYTAMIFNQVQAKSNSICNNTIREANIGVYSTQSKGLNFTDNDIYIRPTTWGPSSPLEGTSFNTGNYWAGFISNGDYNLNYTSNLVTLDENLTLLPNPLPTYNANSSPSGKVFGILVGPHTTVYNLNCDTFSNMHWGVATYGSSAGINIKNNAMNNCQVGLVSFQNGILGSQGDPKNPHDNRWWTTPNTLGLFNATSAGQNMYFRNIPRSQYTPYTNGATYCQRFFGGTPPTLYNITPSPYYDPARCSISPPHKMARLSGYEPEMLEMMARGDLSFVEYPTENQKWVAENLMRIIDENPELRDSLPVLDSFAVALASSPAAVMLDINYSMLNDSLTNAEIDAAIAENLAAMPNGINEENLQTVNNIYLNNFAQGNYDLDSPSLAHIKNIASQCYVTGGPAVFQARSMYWIATNTCDFAFQDNCVQYYNSFKTEPSTNDSLVLNINYEFKLYPTVINQGTTINLFANYDGELEVYNLLGQRVYQGQYHTGMNSLNCEQLQCETGMLVYKTINPEGKSIEGKLINQ